MHLPSQSSSPTGHEEPSSDTTPSPSHETSGATSSSPPTTKLPVPLTQEEIKKRAEKLLQEVERLSAAGQSKFKEQHLVPAKADFESALDMILSSGVDLRKFPRLKQHFDEIFNYLYQIEGMLATTEGDTATSAEGKSKAVGQAATGGVKKEKGAGEMNGEVTDQDLVPAAIDELRDVNVYPIIIESDLQERVVEDIANTRYDIPVIVNEPVLRWLEYFKTKGRKIVELGLRRIGLYREMIQDIFSQNGIPKDLIYLCQQESMFKPLAQSRSRARGMWQFMLGTGKLYGLKQDGFIDEKLDPEKSTRAAAQHLQKLYQMFGDWYLAMAAYNAGEGRILRIIEKTGVTNFWELIDRRLMNEQTASYVPSILAFMIIGKHPEKYGFDTTPLPPVSIRKVTTPSPIDLSAAAAVLGISVQDLHELNPELRRRVTPVNRKTYELNIPADATPEAIQKIASLPLTKRAYSLAGINLASTHKVQPGESLWSISHQYGVSVEQLMEANHLVSTRLQIGQSLAIPGRPAEPAPAASKSAATSVQAKDSKSGPQPPRSPVVAKKAAPSSESSQAAVRKETIEKNPVVANATSKSAGAAGEGEKTILYRVKLGDNLYNIARRYKTTVDLMRQWNKLLSDSLHPGDTLLIYLP